MIALSLRIADDSDREFCEQLNRRNMSAYLARRGIEWDSARFEVSWQDFENLIILNSSFAVGHMRLTPEPPTLGLRDLQILPEYQHQGIGSWAVQQAKAMAESRSFRGLKLRVYEENPATALYARLGFRPVSTIAGTVHLVWDTPSD
ncbi:MAG: GNAT family N-acetyltransferase [Arenimonas sp.]|uniref:GNAT family N-acetyltransferase n=1 Tax=Arenimonas sp. TaxID=1872635 RepID=UPI0025C23E7F|nr:GNAT family N-acetyltransferase [Arenimonas sp.]MBW8366938.1 GNAT family N-acetyltransferase [Arenimonas sp.]